MVDLVALRKDGALIPATRLDLEQLEKIRPGRPVAVSAVFKRSLPHLRFYRALVGVVAEGLGLSPDAFHAELKLRAGLVRRILLAQSGPVVELESVAFNTIDEIRFTEYTTIAERIIFEQFLPGVERKDVIARVEELVGPRPI